MNSKQRTLLVASLATSALLLGAWLQAPANDRQPQAGAVTAAATARGSVDLAEPISRQAVQVAGYTAPAGTRLHFEVRVETGVSLRSAAPEAAPAQQTPLEISATGLLNVLVLGRRADEVLVGYRMPEARLRAAGNQTAEARSYVDGLQQALRRGFDVRMDLAGRTRAMRFHGEWTADGRNFARALTTACRCEYLPQVDWTSDFDDAMGRHSFAYASATAADEVTLTRSRTGFVPNGIAAEAVPDVKFHGTADASFVAAVGWLTSAHVDDAVAWSWIQGALRIEAWQRGSLRWLSSDTVKVEASWDDGFVDFLEPTIPSPAEEDPMHQFWAEKLQGRDLQTLLGELAALEANGSKAERELLELLHLLAELIRQDPANADLLADLVQSARLTGQSAADALTALGMAGHDRAQAALAAVFGNGLVEPGLRQAAVEAMFQVEQPSQFLVDSLQRSLYGLDHFDGCAGSAMLALGAFASRGAQTADGRALATELLQLEAAARRDGIEPVYFDALGNTGSEAVLPLANRLAQSLDPVQRAQAVTVVRRVQGPAAEAILSAAARDANADVRRTALLELAMSQAPWVQDLLIDRATNDTDADVRRLAYSGLGSRAAGDAAVRAVLLRCSTTETDPELHTMLTTLLARG
jgi:hypothetical protein